MEEKEFTQEEARDMEYEIACLKSEIKNLEHCLAQNVVDFYSIRESHNFNWDMYAKEISKLRDENEELKKQLASCDRGYDCYDKSFQNDYLTYKEWKYLKGVIEPFRDKVEEIVKCNVTRGDYIIIILYFNKNICLPYFEEGKHYKGMQRDIHYTLEDLGL